MRNKINKIKKEKNTKMFIYQAKSGAIELRGDFGKETIWATLDQIAVVFGRDKSVISRHLSNIFTEKELDKNSVVAKNATTASDRKTYQVEYFNLDAIISVGYRVNSKTATEFRKWATKILRTHIVNGYTINRSRIAENYNDFLQAVEQVKLLLPAGGEVDAKSVLELIKTFATTWFSLDAYDKSSLPKDGATKKQVKLTAKDLSAVLLDLKKNLVAKKEATDIFGAERQKDSIVGIIGNVFQSFGGRDVYASIEEKAAHLLYFMVKNHPFVDGNKRSGAFAFVWFLKKARRLNVARLTPEALTALTLLVAESNPKDKERMIGLVILLLKK
jgi:prophage maintenance system killer protein